MPADDASTKVIEEFKQWITPHQESLVNPAFPPTATDADAWIAPGTAPSDAGSGAKPGPAGGAAPAPAPAAPTPNAIVAPAAGGAPNVIPQDFVITVHDLRVEEGKNYRYSVQYALYNPLHNSHGLALPALTKKLTIVGPDPATDKTAKVWTDKIAAEPSAYAYVTHMRPASSQAQFDVFRWEGGKWNETTTPMLTPGDPVNAGSAVGRWTVVDVRKAPRGGENYVILMDFQGNLESHDKQDDTDPGHARLKQLAAAPPAH